MEFSHIVDYANSTSVNCGQCRVPIEKDVLRIGEIVQSLTNDDTIPRWFHISCFVDSGLRYPTSTMEIDNFDNIRWKDQQQIIHQIEAFSLMQSGPSGIPWAKKRRIDALASEETLRWRQNDWLFMIRDGLQHMPEETLKYLLSHNRQRIPEGVSAMLDALADAMVFGALKPCKKCTGHFKYVSNHGYMCTGNFTQWTSCEEMTQDPVRVEFLIPQDLADDVPFLKSYSSQVCKRIVHVAVPSTSPAPMGSQSTTNIAKVVPTTIKLYVKPSGVVDPDSGMASCAHVYQSGEDIYTVTLVKISIQQNKNSFYTIQILKYDDRDLYCLFRKWGRTGCKIGGQDLADRSLEECIKQFETLYLDNTGNEWSARRQFVKVAGKMYPIDTDYNEPDSGNCVYPSTLKRPVQDLTRLIFNVPMMEKILREYDLDLDKMPLGKISKEQLLIAYRVLTELRRDLELMKINGTNDRIKIIDASNRFFTLVPHSFSTENVPILDSNEAIKAKCNMLDSLLEIEIAMSMLRLNINSDGLKNPLDIQYEQLNTKIDVLDKNSIEYNVIKQYVQNTHGPTHDKYELNIEEVFVVERQGEAKRYAPFKDLNNRKLLWHGSRITNYAGILSEGLKIAPPEAPSTGYMFGKGIYFADMVSKSANFCLANRQNSTGLLLLCEVALGNMSGRLNADYVTQLPHNKHSIWGLGRLQPDPQESYKTMDGVEIPYGTAVPTYVDGDTALIYNEYVVYDPNQVKIRYLVKVNFIW